MSVCFNIIFTIFEICLMLKDVIKYFKLSKLVYNDKRIITVSIFLIGVSDFKKKYHKSDLSNIYAN